MSDDPIPSAVKGEKCKYYLVRTCPLMNNPEHLCKATAGFVTTPDTTEEIKLCQHEIGGRNLIVCIDGTANQFGEKVCVCEAVQRTTC